MNMIHMTEAASVASNIASKAMLAKLSITGWSGNKKEKRITDDASVTYAAKADRLRGNKSLIAKAALESIAAAGNAAREYHRTHTRPWFDDGDGNSVEKGRRILPAKLFYEYTGKMAEFRQAYERAVSDFISMYPVYIEQSRADLGDLFSEADYPTVQEIGEKFSFRTKIEPLPSGKDFRVDLGEEEVAKITAEIDARLSDGVAAAMRDLWQQIAESVTHMRDKLHEYKPGEKGERATGIFRDSLVENLREIVALLPAMNLTGDAALAKLGEDLSASLLDGITAQDLRDDDALRADTAKAADDILAGMAGYI